MTEQQLEEFVRNYNLTWEKSEVIHFDGDEPAELEIMVKGPKVSFKVLSREPVLFFQQLSLTGYKRDSQGGLQAQLLPLEESPMSLPDISREMRSWGWDCDGQCYIPFYFHRNSGTGLPARTRMGGYNWVAEITDSPGPSFTDGPVDLYPEWWFVVLRFHTFIVRISGIGDVSRVPTAGKDELAGMTFQPAHIVEWFAVPPWGVEGLKLWNRILGKLNTAYMGGLVYPVRDFNPDDPLGGSNRLFPAHVAPESRNAMFFEPLRFWQERWPR